MKIGELAKKCNVTQATIRYYVQSGLLIPDDSSPHYNFSEREYQDLQLILKMKQQHFSLQEIQTYLSLIRHSNFIEAETIDGCVQILNRKKLEISEQIDLLQQSLDDIEREITTLSSRAPHAPCETGVPLSALPLLVCPHCGRTLQVENASICGNHITAGQLVCPAGEDCPQGYQAVIENGIIKTGNLYTGAYDRPDLNRGMYRNMGQELSRCLQKGYDYISARLKKLELRGKVILEANINGYFFLYNHLRLLPEDCLCIVIDKFPEMLEMYKSLIETLGFERNILYIADSQMDYPLRDGCVDVLISYFGENEHQLYHTNCYMKDAKRYLKKCISIVGTFLSYKRNSKSLKNIQEKYPESSDRCYRIDFLEEDYIKNGFRIETELLAAILDTQKRNFAFACQKPGEALSVYCFQAKALK